MCLLRLRPFWHKTTVETNAYSSLWPSRTLKYRRKPEAVILGYSHSTAVEAAAAASRRKKGHSQVPNAAKEKLQN